VDIPAPTPDTWELFPLLSKEQFEAAKQHTITSIQAQLLYNRGLTSVEGMTKFWRATYDETPDPLALIDMPRAVERILQALAKREHITVYGDYDADGVTSSALLFRALRALKRPEAVLDFHIPHRLYDGCGLNLAALDLLKARGTQLIITTDCASSDVKQVAYAQQLGIDVIITDHHRPPTPLPAAYAIVNPWRPDCQYGERFLCGVGIAFKLVQALYRACKRPEEQVQEFLDLVAIGTVADIAPLQGENHTLVRLGLQHLNATTKPGLLELIKHAGLTLGRIQERNISFSLAPRINAAGRMEHASIAFDLLTTDNMEEAARCVQRLEALNQQRQAETSELMQHVREQATLQTRHPIVLVHGDDWHEGIIGLVAGKLAEEIDKPVLVLRNDLQTQLSRGSARSRQGFNIIEALRGFSGHLERYGGHAQAAGFTIASASIEDLHMHLINWYLHGGAQASTLIEGVQQPDETGVVTEDEEQPESKLEQQAHMADLLLSKREPDYKLYKELREIAPFGAGNPEPTFKMEGVRLLSAWASGFEKKNLRLKLGSSASNIAYFATLLKGAELRDTYKHHTHVNIIFRLESTQDDSKQEVWLKILAIEPTRDTHHAPL
jgi:single-stranded-DNA-specific exonuclease